MIVGAPRLAATLGESQVAWGRNILGKVVGLFFGIRNPNAVEEFIFCKVKLGHVINVDRH